MRLGTTLSIPEALAPAPALSHRSEWHSPVPYLFGGLAAMMGLIAFALLILACSYWKLSTYPSDDTNDADSEHFPPQKPVAGPSLWENNVLVIMAGQVIPTFLATPSSVLDAANNSSGAGNVCVESCDVEKIEKVEDVVLPQNDDDLSDDHFVLRIESQS